MGDQISILTLVFVEYCLQISAWVRNCLLPVYPKLKPYLLSDHIKVQLITMKHTDVLQKTRAFWSKRFHKAAPRPKNNSLFGPRG